MKFIYDIIRKPVITERSMQGLADNKYVFEVARDANKIEIRKAVEEIFGVKVASVPPACSWLSSSGCWWA